jgi:Uncharacterised nucleotidyltransferase
VKPDPKTETRLIAIAAGTSRAREHARPEAQELLDRVDWPMLASLLERRRLLPLLGERLSALAGPGAPAWFVETTERAIADCAEHDAWLELISVRLIEVLRAAGIPAITLKGPMLGRELYGGLGRRPSADIDLLVAREDLAGAVRTARRVGYHVGPDPTDAGALPLLHFRLDPATHALPPLELHWRAHWYESRFSRELLLSTVDATAAGTSPPRAHELASLLLFYARDGFLDLRLACDLAAWWDAFGSELETGAIAALIEEHPRLERALLASIRVAGRIVGLPTAALIGPRPSVERRVRLAERLANPDGTGSRQQLIADVWLVDWLLTPPGGRRDCIWRQLHTPGDIGSSLTSPTRRRPLPTLGRAGRLIPRYGLSLMRLAHDRTVTT